jgi:hypothetical protein
MLHAFLHKPKEKRQEHAEEEIPIPQEKSGTEKIAVETEVKKTSKFKRFKTEKEADDYKVINGGNVVKYTTKKGKPGYAWKA